MLLIEVSQIIRYIRLRFTIPGLAGRVDGW